MLLAFLSIFVFVLASAATPTDKSVLVLIENAAIRDTHSIFFKSLTDRSYQLTFKYADDSSLDLKYLGEYTHQHIIIFAPSVQEFGGKLNVKKLLQFIDDGGNILVSANPEIGDALRKFSAECGVEIDEANSSVIDHHNFESMDEGNHNLIIVDPKYVVDIPVITGKVVQPLLYRGIGMSSSVSNALLINILSSSHTSYSHSPEKAISEYPSSVGVNTQLVTGLQARNDARVIFVGSLDFFSNAFFSSEIINGGTGARVGHSGNQALADKLVRWTFRENGVLRVTSVHHHKVGESNGKKEYTITDEIIYGIDVEVKNEHGGWDEYVAKDLQFELVRIDPFIRKTMSHKGHTYEVQVKLPDVYGVFKFVVDYHRIGYSHVFSSTQVSVRPFTHTQYERFITSAYPYYASAISMMGGVLLFSFVYLYLFEEVSKPKSE